MGCLQHIFARSVAWKGGSTTELKVFLLFLFLAPLMSPPCKASLEQGHLLPRRKGLRACATDLGWQALISAGKTDLGWLASAESADLLIAGPCPASLTLNCSNAPLSAMLFLQRTAIYLSWLWIITHTAARNCHSLSVQLMMHHVLHCKIAAGEERLWPIDPTYGCLMLVAHAASRSDRTSQQPCSLPSVTLGFFRTSTFIISW